MTLKIDLFFSESEIRARLQSASPTASCEYTEALCVRTVNVKRWFKLGQVRLSDGRLVLRRDGAGGREASVERRSLQQCQHHLVTHQHWVSLRQNQHGNQEHVRGLQHRFTQSAATLFMHLYRTNKRSHAMQELFLSCLETVVPKPKKITWIKKHNCIVICVCLCNLCKTDGPSSCLEGDKEKNRQTWVCSRVVN